jgi:hypothetical protein
LRELIRDLWVLLLRAATAQVLGAILQKMGFVTLALAAATAVAVGIWTWISSLPGPLIFLLALAAFCLVLNLFIGVIFVLEWVKTRSEGGHVNREMGGRRIRITREADAVLESRDQNQRRRFGEYVSRTNRSKFYRSDVVGITGSG